jgi:hypothetical protein
LPPFIAHFEALLGRALTAANRGRNRNPPEDGT